MKEQDLRNALERFAHKPDEALECAEVAAAILDVSERTLRYHASLPRIHITPTRYNFRCGDIRALARKGGVR